MRGFAEKNGRAGSPLPAASLAETAWPMVKLGDVCEIVSCRGHQLKQTAVLSCGRFPVVSQSENQIEGYTDERIEITTVPLIVFGDHTCTIKKICDPFVVGADGVKLLKPLRHDFDFFYWISKWLATGLIDGEYRRHYSDFSASEIPLPPLSVQREIVERLEKELGEAEKVATGFRRIAENAEAEFKAELDETFKALEDDVSRGGAETRRVRLGDCFDFIDYRGKTPLKAGAGVPLITAKNIRQGYLDYTESFYISADEYATRQTRGIAHKGDILFTTEAPLGFVALADKEEFSTGQRVITFQWKDKGKQFCNKYFLYCLMSDWFQKSLWKQATGATAKGIKASRLVNLQVFVIPFSDQRLIAGRLDAARERCDKIKAEAEKGLKAAENLRKAILKEAFEQ